jgi:hypothetical protein
MASRSKRVTVADRVEVDATKVLGCYQRARDAYCAQVHGFVDWVAGSEHGGAALVEAHVRDCAVRDCKARKGQWLTLRVPFRLPAGIPVPGVRRARPRGHGWLRKIGHGSQSRRPNFRDTEGRSQVHAKPYGHEERLVQARTGLFPPPDGERNPGVIC